MKKNSCLMDTCLELLFMKKGISGLDFIYAAYELQVTHFRILDELGDMFFFVGSWYIVRDHNEELGLYVGGKCCASQVSPFHTILYCKTYRGLSSLGILM